MPLLHRLPQLAGCLAAVFAVCAGVPMQAQAAQRTPIAAAAVAAALSQAGLRADLSRIDLPGTLSSSAEPQLRVNSAELLPDGRLRVRLVCGQTSACQPFFVTVHSASASDAATSLAGMQIERQTGAPTRPMASVHVVAGQHTTLLLADEHMRITLPVIVVDSGSQGAEVRVSSLDRKQTFHALVTETGALRGMLP